MQTLNYIHASDITLALEDQVIPGEHIKVEDIRYERIKSKPLRRRILRTLINEDESITIRIFG